MTDWPSYVAEYHDERPGVSEWLLASALDANGRSPYDWLAEAVPSGELVVDLGCGSGPLLRRLTTAVGIDRSAAELAVARRFQPDAALARADAGRLPVRTGSAGAMTVSLGLMVMVPLADVLAEIARALRPGGTLVATVPVRSAKDEGFAGVLSDLGQTATRYPNAVSGADLRAAGLNVEEDVRRSFVRAVTNGADAEPIVRAFYAPGSTADQTRAANDRLRRPLAAGPFEITFTIRRITASTRA